MKDMPIFSDEDSSDEPDYDQYKYKKPRKAKSNSFKTFFNCDDDDSDIEETAHDSDNDPDFKCNDNNDYSTDDESRVADDYINSDDNMSITSLMTDFGDTLNMLKSTPKDFLNFFGNDGVDDIAHSKDIKSKQLSKRKISKECQIIHGRANDNLWEKNYDLAEAQCERIIKEYPSFGSSYDILSEIYEAKGDTKKANELRFTAAMCSPVDIDQLIVCIHKITELEGLDKAIKVAKIAVSQTLSRKLRDVLIALLEEGGYTKDALVKKLVNLHATPPASDEQEIEKEVEELFYMSEKFESMNELSRAAESLEILNKKYPSYLTDDKLMALLKVLIKLKRFNKVLAVSKNINGITINLNDLTNSADLIVISDDICEDQKPEVIYAILMAILHLKMVAAVQHRSFRTYLKQLESFETYYMNIVAKLFHFGIYDMVIEYANNILNKSNEKLVLLKFIGKSQEKLNKSTEALQTYDYIINEINGKDPSIWELKANLLYNLKREQEAINVLAESQKFVHDHVEEHEFGKLIRKTKPSRESAQLLYKLCELLLKQNQIEEYIKVAWQYIFIDSYEYFKVNKIKLFCADMAFAKEHFYEITNSLWICIPKTSELKYGDNSSNFTSSHLSMPYENEAWHTLERLLDILMKSQQQNCVWIEILSQWGLFLHKFLNWSPIKREKLSSIYVSSAFINRLNDFDLRSQCSSYMILSELRLQKEKYGETVQFWNLFNLYCHLIGTCNTRFVLRCITQTQDSYLPEIINANYLVCNNTKLSIAVNMKVHFQHPENAQICLNLAIIFVNAAISRTCHDPYKISLLAINFMNKYRERRGDCQESWYNLGRFYHRIGPGFYHYAMACYEKCLATATIGDTEDERAACDLSMDAAFNLVLIYKERNNRPMCAFLTQKYLNV